ARVHERDADARENARQQAPAIAQPGRLATECPAEDPDASPGGPVQQVAQVRDHATTTARRAGDGSELGRVRRLGHRAGILAWPAPCTGCAARRTFGAEPAPE